MDDSSRTLLFDFTEPGCSSVYEYPKFEPKGELVLDRRAFLKLALVTSGVAVAGYYGVEYLEMANASVRSIGNTQLQDQGSSFSPVSEWQVAHLLRRAGFGASPDELSSYQKLGVGGAIDQLLNYQNIDDSILPSQPNITMGIEKQSSGQEVGALIWWWVDRMTKTPRPLEEKMTLFWHNHFATAIYKVRSPYLMFKQNQLLRSNAMGNFKDLLMGVTEDPAMLIWLDGARNRKGAANENYGREIMEVFTTGRGFYTEDDVKAAARAFTGYTLDKNGNTKFNPKLHDDGTKTFLGQTGNLGPEDIVSILANHPATARAISTELFQYLAYYNPSTDVIDRLAQVFTSTNGNIKAVVEAILKSNEFISQQAYLEQVKSPVDYVVTALRSLGATAKPAAAIATLNNMGQLPFDPPSVFGWPDGITWINTSTILDRINFPLAIQTASNLSSPQNTASVDQVSRLLFPEGLPAEVITSIQQSNSSLTNPVDKMRNTIRLTMASPFYNLN
jgi:uncharacterized protein (DUF1800 family)